MTALAHVVTVVAQANAGGDPVSWLDVLRHDIIPVTSAYVVFLALLAGYARSRRRARSRAPVPSGPPATWSRLGRYLASTVIGGYLLFLAIVVVFYLVLGGEPGSFVTDALVGGSVLAFVIVVPAFLLLTWLVDRRT